MEVIRTALSEGMTMRAQDSNAVPVIVAVLLTAAAVVFFYMLLAEGRLDILTESRARDRLEKPSVEVPANVCVDLVKSPLKAWTSLQRRGAC